MSRPVRLKHSPEPEIPSPVALADSRLIVLRNDWFDALELERKEEKLFELEALLKGLDRFFNLSNLPLPEKEGIVNRDFSAELKMIRNAVFKTLKICQSLLPGNERAALSFKNYIESRLLNDYQRAQIIERGLHQETPVDSLIVLCFSFINFHEILTNLIKLNKGAYQIFYNMEQLVCREITSNRYFNPFRAAGFAQYYDAIQSPVVNRIVRSIKDAGVKKFISIIILVLYKMLRYLSFIKTEGNDIERLRGSLMFHALIRSEANQLVEYIEQEVVMRLELIDESEGINTKELYAVLDALAFQLDIEFRKIYELELKDAMGNIKIEKLRNGLIRSRGLLSNIFQQNIVQICQFFDPDLQGKEIFKDFVSRLEQSIKLRKDIWLFLRIIENLELNIEEHEKNRNIVPVMEAVKNLRGFIFYYQNVSFQLVRCYDREEFQTFFNMVDGFNPADVDISFKFEPFKRELHSFRIFLETTIQHINNRAELQEMPFGKDEGEKLLAQFLL